MIQEKGVKISLDLFKELQKYKEISGISYKKIIELSWREYKLKYNIK